MVGYRTVLAMALLGCGVCASSASAAGLQESFDGVTPPAVPANWAVSKVGTQAVDWGSSTTTPFSTPNAMFAADRAGNNGCVNPISSDNVIDEILTAPDVTVGAAPRLVFRNKFDTQDGFDGGVLEISRNGGAFQDVLAAGGTFAQNGYTDPIATGSGSPIGGRSAWSGNSGGYLVTIVDFPSVAAGTTLQLRFRMTGDCSVAGNGWWIDDVILGGSPIAVTGAATSVTTGTAILNGTLTVPDLITSYNFEYGTTTGYGSQTPGRQGSAGANQAESEQIAGLEPNTTYHYRIVASNGIGTSTGDDQTLTTAALPPTVPPDTTAPETTIDKVKLKVDKGKAKFTFSSSEAGSHFECRLDKGKFATCSSPQGYKHLDDGKHKFYVRAVDAAGNFDGSPAKEKFKVKLDE
jgi:hypothetical protein